MTTDRTRLAEAAKDDARYLLHNRNANGAYTRLCEAIDCLAASSTEAAGEAVRWEYRPADGVGHWKRCPKQHYAEYRGRGDYEVRALGVIEPRTEPAKKDSVTLGLGALKQAWRDFAAPEGVTDTQRLDWLTANVGMELDWGEPDGGSEEDPCVWRIHKVTGSVNDREWLFMGQGETPRGAIDAALAAQQPKEL